jgi:hypothetical protein
MWNSDPSRIWVFCSRPMKRIILILFRLIILPFVSRAALPALIPYLDRCNGSWGYSDSVGRIVISPRWFSAGFFSGGKALVSLRDPAATYPVYALIDCS